MKIAVDGYDLTRRSTGVGRYLRNLLPEILKSDPGNRYHLFLREDSDLFNGIANLQKTVIAGAGGYCSWQNGPLRRELAAGGFDLLFAASNQLPFFFHGRSIVVVHDVAWRALPGDFSLKERIGKDLKCRWSLKRAERICTDAEFTKKELLRYYRLPAEKIQAIPLAIEPGFKRGAGAEIEAFKRNHGLRGTKTIGFLGSIFGRRHIRELIDAWDRLRRTRDLALMIVGKNFAGKDVADQLRREGIVWREWLPEEELNLFYSSLDLFVYVSDYEGFGFPPLEALACGTVSLLLPTSSLREMYHDLAVFAAAPEPGPLAEAIGSFLDGQTACSGRISDAWRKRKEYFSWPRVAADYLKLVLK
jgi:glycosyltransferase involved in cell wall biosynthesis